MENGSLDKLLFNSNEALIFEKLHEISVGTARGIAYLHEECQQRIVHYDIKPGNVLWIKISFLKLPVSNGDNTHISMTGGRGTPGYAAPELWLQFSVTPKCDVYSFGMLLFEIIGRRKNHDINLPDSQEWFPGLVWKKFESKELGELMVACGIDEKDKEIAERMVNVALWCTQNRPESRPLMSVVVKMLEGDIEIPRPTINPFQHLIPGNPYPNAPIYDSSVATNSTYALDSEFSHTVTGYSGVCATPLMRKYELEIAST